MSHSRLSHMRSGPVIRSQEALRQLFFLQQLRHLELIILNGCLMMCYFESLVFNFDFHNFMTQFWPSFLQFLTVQWCFQNTGTCRESMKNTLLNISEQKKPRDNAVSEPPAGIEPATYWLQVSCSTSWAKEANTFSYLKTNKTPLLKHFCRALDYGVKCSYSLRYAP